MMYQSPIEVLIADIQHQINNQQDEQIYQAVVSVGVNVDKEELIRALRYDRQQYEAGYLEGFKVAVEMFANRVHHEIVDARNSNFKAIDERKAKYGSDYDNDPFLQYCQGKIQALDGIDYFLETAVTEMKKADFCSYGERKDNERKAD